MDRPLIDAIWELFENFKAQVEASELATSTKQTYIEHPKRFLVWLETGRIDTSVRP